MAKTDLNNEVPNEKLIEMLEMLDKHMLKFDLAVKVIGQYDKYPIAYDKVGNSVIDEIEVWKFF